MSPDGQLLDRFVARRDEEAFRELVERHAGLVIGTARRRTGDPDLAREVAQTVFTLLARTAPRLVGKGDGPLAGWLHRTALLQASNALRTEMRRRHHLERFAAESADSASPDRDETAWDAALPNLDAAIDSLGGADREVVLLHFHQRRTFREIGPVIGTSEDGARKRTARALEKLSRFLRRRGVVLSAAALGAGLATRVSEAAPAGFASSTAAAALSGAGSITPATILANTLATTMTLTKITAAAAVVAFATPIGFRWHESRAAVSPPATAQASEPGSVSGPEAVRRASRVAANSDRPVLARFAQELRKLGAADDKLRLIELQRLLLELPEADLAEAFGLIRQTPREKGTGQLLYALFARWAEFGIDPALAASRGLDAESRVSAQTGIILVWTRQKMDGALAWVLGQPPSDERNQLLDMAYHQLMKLDPEKALATLPQVADEAKRTQYRRWTFEVWRATDPEAAIAWLQEKEPEETRSPALREFLHQMAAYRPDLAFKFALTQESPSLREEGAGYAVMQWAFHDTRAALDALAQLPTELQTEGLALSAAPFLAAADINALLETAGALPSGKFRDKLFEQAAAALAPTDSGRALEIASQLPNEDSRRSAYEQIARRWILHDRVAATAWLESTDHLTDEKKQSLLEFARNQP